MGRKKVPKATETELLVACGRKCCLCVFLDGDTSSKDGQVAHLDGDPSNNASSNLAWLCLPHHDRYDTRTSQSKGLTVAEAKRYRDDLHRLVEKQRKAIEQAVAEVETRKAADKVSATPGREEPSPDFDALLKLANGLVASSDREFEYLRLARLAIEWELPAVALKIALQDMIVSSNREATVGRVFDFAFSTGDLEAAERLLPEFTVSVNREAARKRIIEAKRKQFEGGGTKQSN